MFRIYISKTDGEILEEYFTNEDLIDIKTAISNHLAVYDSEEELEDANTDLEIEDEYCGDCEELMDDCICDDEVVNRGRE